jgi:3'-5' exoribonuclease
VLHADARDDGSLHLVLADARERIEARLDDAGLADWVRPGIYVGVRGNVDAGRGLVVLHDIAPVRVTLDELPLFLPGSSRELAEMDVDLAAAIASVEDPRLRALLDTILAPESEAGQGFRLAPAATRNHHAHLGGLLEHTLSVAAICHHLALHYGDAIDRDLLMTGALLHDVGKVREIGAQAGFPYTDEGRLLGHILLGLRMVRSAAARLEIPADRLLLLEHLIASHQGRYEWQSPREPRILEGLILHYADDLDAKMAMAQTAMTGVDSGWSERDRVQNREWLRHVRHDATRVAVAPDASTESPSRVKAPVKRSKHAKPGKAGKAAKRRKAGRQGSRSKATRKTALEQTAAKSGDNAKSGEKSSPRDSAPRTDGARELANQPSPLPVDPHTLDMFG